MADVVIFSDGPRRSLGAYRIANEVRNAGYSCQVISFLKYFTLQEIEQLCNKFINSDTKIVGLSTTFWYAEIISYSMLMDTIRKVNPNVKIILGGPNARRVSALTMHKIDAILSGQGESNILKYLHHLETGEPFLQPTDIWRENIPVYESQKIADDWNFNTSQTIYTKEDCIDYGEPLVLEVARGCIFSCKFCAYPLNGKKKLDYIKYADSLHDELVRNYNDHGIHTYILSDDTFNDSIDKLLLLKDVFTNLPFKFTFSSYARLDLLNAHREEIELLEEMGMIGVNFGVETFHDRAAKLIGKGMVGKIAKDFLHELKTVHWRDRIKIAIGLIQGFPYETYESHEETRNWILDPENLVESVQPHALSIINPVKDLFPYKSEFQINAMKYGFYWPESDRDGFWKNHIGPIKTYDDAYKLYLRIKKATADANRTGQGGFGITVSQVLAKYADTPMTLDDFRKMDRFQFTDWGKENSSKLYKRFINNYKQQIFRL